MRAAPHPGRRAWLRLPALAAIAAAGVGRTGRAVADPGTRPMPLGLLRTADIGGLPVADLSCGGRAGRWIVDTGASRSVVDRGLADELGLPRSGRSDVRLLGRRLTADRVRLPALDTPDGRPVVPGDDALAIDLAAYREATGEPLLGIVGLPALGAGAVLDPHGGRWWREAGPPPDSPARLRVDPPTGAPWPSIPVTLPDGTSGPCLLDSGFAGVMLLHPAASARWLDGPRAVPRLRVRELAATVEVAMGRLPVVRLGDRPVEDVPVLLQTGPPGAAGPAGHGVIGLVGTGMVEHGRLQLVAPGGAVSLDWPGGPPRFPGGFGLGLRPQGRQLQVSAVVDGSPAQRAGLRPGERLATLDGAPVTNARPGVVWAALRGRETADLGVRAAGDDDSAPVRTVHLARSFFLPVLDGR